MDGMVRRAQDLMYGGAYGVEALSMLREFNFFTTVTKKSPQGISI